MTGTELKSFPASKNIMNFVVYFHIHIVLVGKKCQYRNNNNKNSKKMSKSLAQKGLFLYIFMSIHTFMNNSTTEQFYTAQKCGQLEQFWHI